MSAVTQEKGVNLDEVKEEARKLLALLEDPHPGLFTWNDFLRIRFERMHELSSQALGK
jgi:hypothetical protein